MALWGRNDADANTAPKHTVVATSNKTCIEAFGNTTVGAIVPGQAVGVFGVDATEATVTDMVAHPGWVIVRQGTGFVDSIAINDGGEDYTNTDTFVVSGGAVNATGTIVADANGTITALNLTNKGSGFQTTSNLVITTSAGTGANVAVVLGGRAGRVHAETIVAMGTIQSDASDDTLFPDS